MILLITKTNLVLENNEVIRDIYLDEIDAITLSKNSSEFIIHVIEDYDERLSSYNTRNEIVEMILYLLTTRNKSDGSPKVWLPIYFVAEINLDMYTTTQEDLEDGHIIRPEDKDMKKMNYHAFLEQEEKQKRK